MDTEVFNVLDGTRYNRFGNPLIECQLCGGLTAMTGTKRCDRCWELETRILLNVELAEKILKRIREEETKNA